VNLKGIDLDGNELEIEADELFGRLIQHEIDHLNGKLMLEYLDPDQLKEAKKTLREYLTNKANESYLQDENN
jgi:peptide deformylase